MRIAPEHKPKASFFSLDSATSSVASGKRLISLGLASHHREMRGLGQKFLKPRPVLQF